MTLVSTDSTTATARNLSGVWSCFLNFTVWIKDQGSCEMYQWLYLESEELIYQIQRPSLALGSVQCINVHPWPEQHLLEMLGALDNGTCGVPRKWRCTVGLEHLLLLYLQFTVTLTCLTSAEETSLAALHSYLPDCSLVMPRISRYSSSPSNSLPEKYRKLHDFFLSLKYAADCPPHFLKKRNNKSERLFNNLTTCFVWGPRHRPQEIVSSELD